jgi:DNA-binding PadR family transcriptional regulator
MKRKPGSLLLIELSILATGLTLGPGEFHGYLLAREMQEREAARRLVSHGTLYKALDRLEAAGLLASRWEDPQDAARENRPRRRLYQVTAAGAAAAQRLQLPASPVGPRLREEPLPG